MTDDAILARSITLGTDATDAPVTLPIASLMRGTYITGLQGTGKSNLLKHLFWEVASTGAGALFIDPHGDVSRELVTAWPEHERNRLVFLDASDEDFAFGLNLFAVRGDSLLAKQRMVDDVLTIFEKIYRVGEATGSGWGQLIETTLQSVAQIFADHPGMTLTEVLPFLYDQAFRERLLAGATTYPDAIDYWRRFSELSEPRRNEIVRSTERKLLKLVTHPLIRHVVGQSSSRINVRDLMDARKLVVVRLSRGEIRDEALALFSTILIAEVLTAALSRSETTDRPPFVAFVDELQVIAVRDLASLISEARKFNVGIVMANQFLEQLDLQQRTSVLTVVNRIAFQVAATNARKLVEEDYFKAEREPVMKRQPKLQRIMEEQPETYWDPPEAEEAHRQTTRELRAAQARLAQTRDVSAVYLERWRWLRDAVALPGWNDLLLESPAGIRLLETGVREIVEQAGERVRETETYSVRQPIPFVRVHRQRTVQVRMPVQRIAGRGEYAPPIYYLDVLLPVEQAAELVLNLAGHALPEPKLLDAAYRRELAGEDPWRLALLDELAERLNQEALPVTCMFVRAPDRSFFLTGSASSSHTLGLVQQGSRGYLAGNDFLRDRDGQVRRVWGDYSLRHVVVKSPDRILDGGDLVSFFRTTGAFLRHPYPETRRWLAEQLDDAADAHAAVITPGIDEVDRLLKRIARLERHRKTRMRQIDTGFDVVVKRYNPYSEQHETVYELGEGDLESLGAAKTRLAQTLAHLPDRTILTRVRRADGSLWQGIVSPPQARFAPYDPERIARFQAQSRRGYCQSRTAVEAQIAQRRQQAPEQPLTEAEDPFPFRPR